MGAEQSGYVDAKDYKVNPDGTLTYKLTSINPPNNNNITLPAILNTNHIKSPNNPDQILIMSSDDKYIFLSSPKKESLELYVIIYAYLNYNITIPTKTNCDLFKKEMASLKNDPRLDGLSNFTLILHAGYLLGQSPTPALLNIDSKIKTWNDIGFYYKSFSDLFGISVDKVAPSVPVTVCMNYTSSNPSSNDCRDSGNDCRSCPGAKTELSTGMNAVLNSSPSDSSTSNSSTYTIYGAVVIVLCCCCSLIGGAFIMMSMQKHKKR